LLTLLWLLLLLAARKNNNTKSEEDKNFCPDFLRDFYANQVKNSERPTTSKITLQTHQQQLINYLQSLA